MKNAEYLGALGIDPTIADGFLKKYKTKKIVVKFGGEIIDNEPVFNGLIDDIEFLYGNGVSPVYVPGGGVLIEKELRAAGREIRPKKYGERYTEKEDLPTIDSVLKGINDMIVSRLRKSCKVEGLHNIILAERRSDGFGFTGIPYDVVDKDVFADRETIYVVSCFSHASTGPDDIGVYKGGDLNSNGDRVALVIAKVIGADVLVYMTNTHGVLVDGEMVSELTAHEAQKLIDEGIVTDGMVPKVEAIVCAKTRLHVPVRDARIINGNLEHSLLYELLTEDGCGTRIVL